MVSSHAKMRVPGWAAATALILILLVWSVSNPAPADETWLDVDLDGEGRMLVDTVTTGYPGRIIVLEAATNLADGRWICIHADTNDVDDYADRDSLLHPAHYVRASLTEPPYVTPSPTEWKANIELSPYEPFLSDPINDDYTPEGGGDPILNPNKQCWVKFQIFMDDLTTVYFQNQQHYDFHYQFAVNELDPFFGMSHEDYLNATLYETNRQAILGTVIIAPNVAEYAIQFTAADEIPREMIRFLYETVDAAMTNSGGYQGFYMPTAEQSALAQREQVYFADAGIQIASPDRWSSGKDCYAEGWALGRLVFVASTDIADAYVQGDLLPTDVLLTDEVPADVPYVAGIISLAPSTPNSHVAILANAYGIPFLHISDSNLVETVWSLTNREVVVRAYEAAEIRVLDVDDSDQTLKDELLALKEVPPLEIDAKETFGAYSTNVDNLIPADITYFGGKAANFGFLRRVLPLNSPEALAFSFDLWDEYMDQMVNASNTLREAISNLISGYTYPPGDLQALDADLSTVRDLIEDTADFNPTQTDAILTVLSNKFSNLAHKIRFRSSTNVEDSEHFSGAGLYESYSGCLMDDLDGDGSGPSYCDFDEPNERGVLRAMRKVYASFYDLTPFLERLRRQVDESEVGMAILAHYNFPDEEELANGVAISVFDEWVGSTNLKTSMVSQPGAASVTNPEGTDVPEIMNVEETRGTVTNTWLTFEQRSDLLPLGETYVLDWQADYLEFGSMFFDVATAVHDYYERELTVDFEYKKMDPGGLVVKQVREVPSQLDGTSESVLFNLAGPWRVMQAGSGLGSSENMGVFANHRLKSAWYFETDERWLDSTGQASCVFTQSDWDFLQNGTNASWTGTVSNWPTAFHTNTEESGFFPVYILTDSWDVDSTNGPIRYSLIVTVPQPDSPKWVSPVCVLADLDVHLRADYPVALTNIGWPESTTTQIVRLEAQEVDPVVTEVALEQQRSVTTAGVSIVTEFYWPLQPIGAYNDYTAPLLKWKKTTITGLTSEPIELYGYYSQTYSPERHNQSEEFLFEPRLEPGMSATILQELEAADIAMIYLYVDQWGQPPVVKIVSLDGVVGDLP